MKHPVAHFEIMSKNPVGLRAFYRDVFGWQFNASTPSGNSPDYTTIDPMADFGVSGGIGQAPDGYAGHLTFYIVATDMEDAFKRVEAHGGTHMMGPDTVPMPEGKSIRIGLFRDPEQHVVGLVDPSGTM